MTKRNEHTFQFTAGAIATAAGRQAQYHLGRLAYWIAAERAGIEIYEANVTEGTRKEIKIDYGDMAAYRRMQESWQKITNHRDAAERLRTEQRMYESQPATKAYDLDSDDVHFFNLAGESDED